MSRVELEREEAGLAAAGVSDKLTTLMEKLLERMDRIERQTTSDRGRREPDRAAGKDPWRRPFTGECWRCGKTSPGTAMFPFRRGRETRSPPREEPSAGGG